MVMVAWLVARGPEPAAYKHLLRKINTFSAEARRLNEGQERMPKLGTRVRLIDEFSVRLAVNAQ